MQRLLQLRHKLHANPRVSNNEAETAAWLQEFMGAHSLQPSMSNVGGNAHRIAVPHFFFNSCINITDRPILAYAVGIRGLVGWLFYALIMSLSLSLSPQEADGDIPSCVRLLLCIKVGTG